MTETKEREAYRMKCRYYGVEGNCHKRSLDITAYGPIWDTTMKMYAVVNCTPDCGCTRMKRFDKRKKEEKI